MTDEANDRALEDHIDLARLTANKLPKLVETLRDLPPLYRRKAIEAAMVLLQDVIE